MTRVAFVGLGAMGLPMATNLLANGFTVTGYDLNAKALDALESAGGKRAGTGRRGRVRGGRPDPDGGECRPGRGGAVRGRRSRGSSPGRGGRPDGDLPARAVEASTSAFARPDAG